MAANPTANHVLTRLPAGRAQPGKHKTVSGHSEAGSLFDFRLCTLKQAVRQRRDGTAFIAPDVIVMTPGQLVSNAAVAQRDLPDHPTPLEPVDGSKH
jgi:hypothetical protein